MEGILETLAFSSATCQSVAKQFLPVACLYKTLWEIKISLLEKVGKYQPINVLFLMRTDAHEYFSKGS